MATQSDLERYMAKVKERILTAGMNGPRSDANARSQADVAPLLAMVRKFLIRHPRPRHTFCTCGPCAHYELLNRLAGEVMGE